jgi:peptide/nickel transport system permease protein
MLIPVVAGVSFIVFMIISLTPGDATTILLPKDATPEQYVRLREELGLDDPLIEQYGRYMLNMLRGSLGVSWYTNESVLGSFVDRLPATALLAIGTLFVATLLAVPLGVYSSLHPHSVMDRIFATASFIGVSMPGFWLGLLLIIVFAANLRLLPSGGSGTPAHLILPSVMLGTNHSAEIMRMTRASMLEVVNADFVRMARSKGLSEPTVIYHHALRNAIIPVITIMGHQFANGFGGSVITETVFSWPGVGRLLIEAINRQDRPMIMGCMIMITVFICVCNLFIDILYAFADPRIKAEYNKW